MVQVQPDLVLKEKETCVEREERPICTQTLPYDHMTQLENQNHQENQRHFEHAYETSNHRDY